MTGFYTKCNAGLKWIIIYQDENGSESESIKVQDYLQFQKTTLFLIKLHVFCQINHNFKETPNGRTI